MLAFDASLPTVSTLVQKVYTPQVYSDYSGVIETKADAVSSEAWANGIGPLHAPYDATQHTVPYVPLALGVSYLYYLFSGWPTVFDAMDRDLLIELPQPALTKALLRRRPARSRSTARAMCTAAILRAGLECWCSATAYV
jgi:hypothetical protein